MPIDVSQVLALGQGIGSAARAVTTATNKTVRESTKAVERGAKSRAPVDTGELRGSITSATRGNTGQVSAGARYAFYNEYGTSKMAPQPFMIPAVEAEEPKFVTSLEAAALAAIAKAIGG